MSNAAVTSILARCLLDAAFLDELAVDPPSATRGYDLNRQARTDVEALEVDRVRRFAAFIAKVQHNFLWESFPYTVRLLKLHHLELEVFEKYLVQHQRLRRQGASRERKLTEFTEFLRRYLESKGCLRSTGLLDVLAHEQLELEIRQELAASPGIQPRTGTISSLSNRDFRRLIPAIRGALRLGCFSRNPCAVLGLLDRGEYRPSTVVSEPVWLAYWGDVETQELRVIEMDDASVALLAQVDGRRSTHAIACRCRKAISTPPDFSVVRSLLEALAEHSVLALEMGKA